MRRPTLIALLAVGTIGGYALGFGSLRCHGAARRAAFERHVAQVCAEAARAEPGGPTAAGAAPAAAPWAK